MIVFDLDGTLALDEHRSHLLKGEVKLWDAYFELCDKDAPNVPLIDTLKALCTTGVSVGIWSGRSSKVIDKTTEWLNRQGIYSLISELRMRHEDDRTPDDELKRSWLHASREAFDPVTLVFEDRQRVVDMWRSEGVVCCQVAPGAF